MPFFLKLDPRTRKPLSLIRTQGGNVDVWDGDDWRQTALSPMQVAGLGGDAEFYSIKDADLGGWQKKLPAN